MQLLTINELAKILKVKPSWIRYRIFHSEIPYLKVGRHIRFDQSSIDQWLAKIELKVEGINE
jgi:excisionase family DNA binding protein